MVTERKLAIRQPVEPKGEVLAAETIEIAAEALGACYPSLMGKYSNRASIDLAIAPFEQVQQERISNLPTQKSVLEESLLKSKIIKTPFVDQRGGETELMYWSTKPNDKLYISKTIFDGLNSLNKRKRINSAINLGQLFIANTIKWLPIPRELQAEEKKYWQEMSVKNLHKFTEEFKSKNMVDSETLDRLQLNLELNALKSPSAKFVAFGAEVRTVLPDQEIEHPAFSIGDVLNKGIVELLSNEAQLKFILLMRSRLSFTIDSLSSKRSASQELASETTKKLGIKDNNSLFEFYVASQLPEAIFLTSQTLA